MKICHQFRITIFKRGVNAKHVLIWICLLLTTILQGCEKEEAQFDDLAKPVRWETVKPSDFSVRRTLSGVLQPVTHADLSFEVGGQITEILVEPGDMVDKGDPLAVLQKETYLLNVEQREGQLQQAIARLGQANSDYERKKNLLAVGAVSELEYENSRTRYEALRKEVKTLRAQHDIALEDLENTTIFAPYDGQISDRYLDPAQQVQPGTRVVRIQGGQGMEVSIAIPETFVEDLAPHQAHNVRFPAYPELVVEAELTELSSEADETGSFPAILKLADRPEVLKAGMTAQVTLVLKPVPDSKSAPSLFPVPMTALLPGKGQDYSVYIYDRKSQTAVKTSVVVQEMNRDTALVSSGLNKGDILISHGAAFLHDGQKVSLIGSGASWYQE